MSRPVVRIALLAFAMAAADGCGSSGPSVPSSLTKVREVPDNVVGASDSAVVKVTDASGTPSPGVTVSFTATGGGTVSASTASTGSNGMAGVLWTLGRSAGAQSVTASSGTVGSVTFNVNARVGPAASISKIGADPVGPPAAVNIDSIGVLVVDQFGNPRVGDQVTFAVTAGGGSVSPTAVNTSAAGRASVRWTLGATPLVLNTATATVAGLPPVTWSTTTTKAAAVLVLKSPRIILVDSGATATVDFEARDGAGAVLADQPLVAVSRTPAANFGNGVVTGLRRGQTFIVVSSELNAAAKDSVLVVVGVPNAPVLVTDLTRTDFGLGQTLVVTVIVDMRTSGARLGALTTLVTWNPSLLTYVSDAEGTPAIGATVNAAGAAGGSLALTMASAGGLAGRIQLRQITFRTGTAVGATGSLLMLPTELRATTFADLLLSTVTASYPLIIK